MTRRSLAQCAAAYLIAFGASAEETAPLSVRDLFANPLFQGPALSPDGQTFAVIRTQGDVELVLTRGVAGGPVTPVAKVDDPEIRLQWLQWANDSRILMSGATRAHDALGVRARRTQLFGVDRDGKNFRWLGKRWPRFGNAQVMTVQFEDNLAHMTPDDPEHVLITFNSPMRDEWPKVMRLNVDSGALKHYASSKPTVRSWWVDANAAVRAGIGYTAGDEYELWARTAPEKEFEVVIRHPAISDQETFAGFHEDPEKIYVWKGHDGRNAVFEFDLSTKRLGPLVFAHPEVDVDGLLPSPAGDERVIGFRYTTDSPQLHFVDAAAEREHQALSKALAKEFGQAVQLAPASRSRDGKREILYVSSDTQPPCYFVYDRSIKQLFPLIEQRPHIKPEQLSPTKRVTYQARDGLAIPAFLTLPRGREAKGLPLIALVHGGPSARDLIQWDPEVQLFASHGFAVLQMNFRGSTGYGKTFHEAGYRQWGQKIQDDITDGVAWAIAEGIADPDRVGIHGGSFGGYSSLAGAVKTPGLYRAAAAYAAVTDIELTLSEDKWYEQAYDYAETMIGGERGDKERLRAASPLRHAAEIRIPVLLGHGADDPTVHVRQSQRMAKALRAAGRDVEYLEFPDEVHGFLLEANRIRWYEALIAFFEKNLAPREKAAAADAPAN